MTILVTCSGTAFIFFLVWFEEKKLQIAFCSLTSVVVSFAFKIQMNQSI